MASNSPTPQTKNNGSPPTPEAVRAKRMAEMSRDPDDAPIEPSVPRKPRRGLNLSRQTLIFALAGVGAIVAALALGWLLGSLNQPAPAAWQSSPAYEKMYLSWVADRYAKTGDTLQAQRDLQGARREDVAASLDALVKETTDPTKRQRLGALTDVIRPPVSQTSFMPMLMAQPVFVFSLLLSFAPLLAAIAILVVPYIRERIKPAPVVEEIAIEEAAQDAALEELLADVKIEDPAALVEVKTEEAAPEEQKQEEEEEEEEEQRDDSGGLGDLASLFEEEDTSLSALEAFCKGLAEINMDNLMTNAKETIQNLRSAVSRRA
jgi:ribosomal protein L12E/L44/L45/RPP1/RPP2